MTHLGAEDKPLNRAFAALWMISAIARVMRPGCKADHMLILEGPQGARKSTALKVLAGEDWFTDELGELGSKDTALQMRGVWIIEIAELDSIGRAEVERIKSFLTRTIDRYRPPYGRYVVEVPRQCVFAGTVNPDTYLRDETGNRRFWPLRCGTIDVDAIRRDRDQLWAEAFHLFEQGVTWWLPPELKAAAEEEQEARYEVDPWEEVIRDWVSGRTKTYVKDIARDAVGIETSRRSRRDQNRITAILKRLGWVRGQKDWRGDVPWIRDIRTTDDS